jgi:hypothetical protein
MSADKIGVGMRFDDVLDLLAVCLGLVDILDLGQDLGVVGKSGAYLSLGGQNIGQGREKARGHLLENGEQLKKLLDLVTEPTLISAA